MFLVVADLYDLRSSVGDKISEVAQMLVGWLFAGVVLLDGLAWRLIHLHVNNNICLVGR